MRIDLEPLDPALRDLLTTARQRDADDAAFDSEKCERLLARVEREIGAGSSTPTGTAFGLRLGSSGPIAAACAAVAIAAVIAGSMREPGDAPVAPPAIIEPAVATTSAPASGSLPEDETDERNVVPTVSVDELPSLDARPTTSAAPIAKTDTTKKVDDVTPKLEGALSANLAGELQIVDAARAAIAKRRHAEALRLLAEHEASFPNGQLAQERERLWIQALVATGDDAQARSRAAAFRRHHPNGLLLPAVERALEGERAHAP
jgi:hypothetical protein